MHIGYYIIQHFRARNGLRVQFQRCEPEKNAPYKHTPRTIDIERDSHPSTAPSASIASIYLTTYSVQLSSTYSCIIHPTSNRSRTAPLRLPSLLSQLADAPHVRSRDAACVGRLLVYLRLRHAPTRDQCVVHALQEMRPSHGWAPSTRARRRH